MDTFYICHCGNTKNNHNFRHVFEEKRKVVKTKIANKKKPSKIGYILDALEFPVLVSKKCSYPDCRMDENMHKTLINEEQRQELRDANNGKDIIHSFTPIETEYRHVNFMIPEDSKCHVCEETLVNHRGMHKTATGESLTNNHYFTTKVSIKNLESHDVVQIQDPDDEDIKIIYN